MRGLFFALLLSATPAWAESGMPIRIYGGSGFGGWVQILLYPDDTQQVSTFEHSKGLRTTDLWLQPGAFQAALAYLRENPLNPDSLTNDICPDYGSDTLEYGDLSYSVACPDPQLDGLIGAMKGIITSHGGKAP